MSEYINNVTRRKEVLKSVLRQLHAGKSVEEVQAEFGALAAEIGSGEIAEIEQMLIDEGLPVEEIQNLCDVHVAVFRAGLDDRRAPDAIPGHPVYTFRQENQVLARMLNEMQRTLDQARAERSADRLRAFAMQVEALDAFDCHYRRKEYLLFPYLEQYGFSGPSKVMWGLHDETRAQLRELLTQAQNGPDALERVSALFTEIDGNMRSMAYKEEKILFPASLEHLKEADWAAIRAQESEIGYFFTVPAREWQPVTAASLHAQPAYAPPAPVEVPAGPAAAALELPLQTGALTLAQIDLMLRSLPVDITYVDADDTVRYYSQTRERIFERTPAIIGRKVQNCHPPQSIGRVQQIIDDFRAGKRDNAGFWIQMGPKFVYIQYFALRDAQGAYQGTLEVTQDIAPLRALQGEKRLLDH